MSIQYKNSQGVIITEQEANTLNKYFIAYYEDGVLVKEDVKASKIAIPTTTITKLLKIHNSTLKAAEANAVLCKLGILSSTKPYKILAKGLRYGRNEVTGNNTVPRWFSDSFADLLKLINKNL